MPNPFPSYTATNRQCCREDYARELADCHVPAHCRQGLIDYLVDGRPAGDFLMAVLTNNLKEAVIRADDTNQRALVAYVRFLYNHAPAPAWGSPEKVMQWIADFEQERTCASD